MASTYVTREQKRFLIKEVLERRDVLIEHNGSRNPEANSRRRKATKEVLALARVEFDREFSDHQIRKVITEASSLARNNCARRSRYMNATGGGYDSQEEEEIQVEEEELNELAVDFEAVYGETPGYRGIEPGGGNESAVIPNRVPKKEPGEGRERERASFKKKVIFVSEDDNDHFHSPRALLPSEKEFNRRQLTDSQHQRVRAKKAVLPLNEEDNDDFIPPRVLLPAFNEKEASRRQLTDSQLRLMHAEVLKAQLTTTKKQEEVFSAISLLIRNTNELVEMTLARVSGQQVDGGQQVNAGAFTTPAVPQRSGTLSTRSFEI